MHQQVSCSELHVTKCAVGEQRQRPPLLRSCWRRTFWDILL